MTERGSSEPTPKEIAERIVQALERYQGHYATMRGLDLPADERIVEHLAAIQDALVLTMGQLARLAVQVETLRLEVEESPD